MSKVKEITVEVKKSRNFQTYSASETVIIEDDENADEIRTKIFQKLRAAVLAEIRSDIA